MVDELIIVNLLSKLSQDHKYITWKMRCCFSDGMGGLVYEISIFNLNHQGAKKTIVFQMNSGKVLSCGFKDIEIGATDTIIDILLDLCNYQKGGT